jgi:hypothetical protein
MEIEPIGGAHPSPRAPIQPVGVTAELADTRKRLRNSVPPDQWEAVLAEVSRLQFEQKMPPLAALQAVYAKLASGWLPTLPRS